MFLALLKKDLLHELRTLESLVAIISLSILISVVAAVGFSSASLSPGDVRKIFPVLLWIVFIFSSTISIARSFEGELEHRAIDRLLVIGVSPVQMYLAKLVSNLILVGIGQVVVILSMLVLFNISAANIFLELVIVSFLVVLGYTALACLALVISSSSRVKSLILPIILIPLLFPLFLAGVELTVVLFLDGIISWSSGWLSLLIALDVIYVALGINLFQYVIRE